MTSEHSIAHSPTNDVTYDEDALRDAERRMHVSDGDGAERDLDPAGGHDPAALEEAAERIGSD